MLEQVLHALRRVKLDPVRLESDVSAAISRAMNVAGIPFETEVKLEQGSRVDFLARGGVVIEVKKGKPNAKQVLTQILRYVESPRVNALILASERSINVDLNRSVGKPVHFITLTKNWGIVT